MKCLYDIFSSDRDFFDDLFVLLAAQDLIISHAHTLYPFLDYVIYRMKELRLITHILYRLVQHCPPERCLHRVGPNSEQNSWCMFRSAFSAANRPTILLGCIPCPCTERRGSNIRQTVVVGPWSCVLLYCQTVQWRRMKSWIERIKGYRP